MGGSVQRLDLMYAKTGVGVRLRVFDLPRSARIVEATCPRCGMVSDMREYDWPEQASDLWRTQCGSCGYLWDRRGR